MHPKTNKQKNIRNLKGDFIEVENRMGVTRSWKKSGGYGRMWKG
jgi:hypothetical protein